MLILENVARAFSAGRGRARPHELARPSRQHPQPRSDARRRRRRLRSGGARDPGDAALLAAAGEVRRAHVEELRRGIAELRRTRKLPAARARQPCSTSWRSRAAREHGARRHERRRGGAGASTNGLSRARTLERGAQRLRRRRCGGRRWSSRSRTRSPTRASRTSGSASSPAGARTAAAASSS